MHTKIFDYSNGSQDVKSLTTLLNDLGDGIDLHFDNLNVIRVQHSNTFRMMFKNNGGFDNCKLCTRLYSCPKL